MSSVPFKIGYNEERRSSRVLKPPGGGNSNIFGTEESPPVSRRRNFAGRTDSNIMNIPDQQENDANTGAEEKKTETQTEQNHDTTPVEETSAANGKGDENPSTNRKNVEFTHADEKGDDNKTNLNKHEQSLPQQAQPQMPINRGRIPPGGFSTKLW